MRTMSSRKVRLTQQVALAASVVSIMTFLFLYPRQVELIFLFARFELLTDYLWLLAAVLCVLILIFGEGFVLKWYHKANRPIPNLVKSKLRSKWGVALIVCALIFGGAYVRLQYQIFSKLYYQERALDAVQKRKMLQARLICEEYVHLYPERSQTGKSPDRVCGAILDFEGDASALGDYVSKQKPNLREVDGVVLPTAPAAKEETLRILKSFTTDADQ
jgi:hypothetical protein